MKPVLHGTVSGPVVAVVGSWDPLIAANMDLLRLLARYGQRAKLTPVAIVLHPNPAKFALSTSRLCVYDDLLTRLELIRSCGVDNVLVIRFSRSDIALVAKDFFDVVETKLRLSQIWLGVSQSLGSGPAGGKEGIEQESTKRGISVRRLEHSAPAASGRAVQNLLPDGRLKEAIEIVGRPPIRHKPGQGRLRFMWGPGRYLVVRADDPARPSPPIPVQLIAGRRNETYLEWPDPVIRRIAFIAGPADDDTHQHRG